MADYYEPSSTDNRKPRKYNNRPHDIDTSEQPLLIKKTNKANNNNNQHVSSASPAALTASGNNINPFAMSDNLRSSWNRNPAENTTSNNNRLQQDTVDKVLDQVLDQDEQEYSPILKVPLPDDDYDHHLSSRNPQHEEIDMTSSSSPILKIPLTPTNGDEENEYQKRARLQETARRLHELRYEDEEQRQHKKQNRHNHDHQQHQQTKPLNLVDDDDDDNTNSRRPPSAAELERQRRIKKMEMEERIQAAREHQYKADHNIPEGRINNNESSSNNESNSNKHDNAFRRNSSSSAAAVGHRGTMLNARQVLEKIHDQELQYYRHTFEVGMIDQTEDELRLRYAGSARYFFSFFVFIGLIMMVLAVYLFATDSDDATAVAIGLLVASFLIIAVSCSMPTARVTVIDVKTGKIEFYKNSFFCTFGSHGCCYRASCSAPFHIRDLRHVRQEIHGHHNNNSSTTNQNTNDNKLLHHQSHHVASESSRGNHSNKDNDEQSDGNIVGKETSRKSSSSSNNGKDETTTGQPDVDVYLGFKESPLKLFLETHALRGEVLVYSIKKEEDGKRCAEVVARVVDIVKEQVLGHEFKKPTLRVTKSVHY